jgi:hypothetical protein
MLLNGRANPHLRLTAAILVAMLAALAGGYDGGFDGERGERTRRGNLQSFVGGLRLVSVGDDAPRVHLAEGLRAVRFDAVAAPAVDLAASGTAGARAELRARLDASRASGAALLRTTALPPPVA